VTIGLSIIARDEEASLPGLLESVAGSFDQVVLADTGSTDRTVEVFEEWAEGQDLPLGWRVGSFEWCDDFGAARTFADSLLTTDWTCYANADDEVHGAAILRQVIAYLPPEVNGVKAAWDYCDGGPPLLTVRAARRGVGRWVGRVHELLEVSGGVAVLPPQLAMWTHRRRRDEADWIAGERRNDAILRKWLEDEPDNERARHLSSIPSLAEAGA
jgi:glycosyltransferase involved in cell wall biosynthesis